MMKRIFLLVAYLFTSFSAFCQEPVFEWAVQMGGALSDSGHSIATDTFGNVYTTGSFSNNAVLSDTADFDSGPGFYGLFSNGDADIFVSKLSADGDLLWAVSFGGSEYDSGYGITTDESGNVFVTGEFKGGVDFDPGGGIFPLVTPPNYSSAFVLKLDTNGSFIWARELGDGADFSPGASRSYSIVVDDDGNVYTTGRAKDNSDFDPGPNEFILTTNTNSDNVFISKLDSDGDFVWAKAIGGEGTEHANAIALDKFNNLYVTGLFSNTVDFDPGLNEYNISAISGDLFVLKLSEEGDFIWVKNLGGASASISGRGLAIDTIGNIYITGTFFDTVDFDPGVQIYEISSIQADVFILKLDIDGNFLWAKSIGAGMGDFGYGIELDNYSNVYITGLFKDTVDFDPGIGTHNLLAIGGDAFVLKLNVEGSFVWAASFTGSDESNLSSSNEGRSIVLDKWANIYIIGGFIDTTDFDPDTTSYNLVSYGTLDVFIQKMSQPCNTTDTTYLELTTCDTLLVGVFESKYSSQNYCDSIVIENVSFLQVPETPTIPTNLIIQEEEPPFQIVVPEIANATEYVWTVPAGVEILSGAGTNNIIVDWDDQILNDSVCVTAINECGSSPTACLEVTVDIIDVVEDIQEKSYHLFPNPTADHLNIVFENDKHYKITLNDFLGRELLRINDTSGHNILPTKNLPSGIYWLKIINSDGAFEGEWYLEKIEVQK